MANITSSIDGTLTVITLNQGEVAELKEVLTLRPVPIGLFELADGLDVPKLNEVTPGRLNGFTPGESALIVSAYCAASDCDEYTAIRDLATASPEACFDLLNKAYAKHRR